MEDDNKPSGIVYGRRKSDLLPGVMLQKDGRLHLKAAHYANLNQQMTKLSKLMDVSRLIMAEMALDALLQLIMTTVTQVMNADRSSLFLIDRERNELWTRVAQGVDELRLPFGTGIVGHVAATGETINIPDAYADPRFDRSSDMRTGYCTQSILCMAIKNQRNEIIGSIQVLNKCGGESFTEADEEFLTAFCSLAGISLENAKNYEELEQERAMLEVKVEERTRDLALEKKKSDELLLNILPFSIAEELKARGAADTRHYEQVTVLFTDFKGFTKVAEKLDPDELVRQLDQCFYYFDELTERFRLEKIKTIGDSYMCAGGLPEANATNPVDAVMAALEIRNFMDQMRDIKQQLGEPYWELRIGIHTGPVIAGVVGKKKFAYDIWGDTVNTASRMESSGESDRINISGDTYGLVKDFFQCTYRGKVAAKNKGEIDMYFVEGILPELSAGGAGSVPNDRFRERLQTLVR